MAKLSLRRLHLTDLRNYYFYGSGVGPQCGVHVGLKNHERENERQSNTRLTYESHRGHRVCLRCNSLGHDLPDLVYDKPHEASAEGRHQKLWLFPTSTFIDYLLKGFVCRRNFVLFRLVMMGNKTLALFLIVA